jgi:hypothetical protein
MAAFDTYQAFTRSIPERDQQGLRDLQSMTWNDLVAARSEEARLRVVENYMREVHERLTKQKGS